MDLPDGARVVVRVVSVQKKHLVVSFGRGCGVPGIVRRSSLGKNFVETRRMYLTATVVRACGRGEHRALLLRSAKVRHALKPGDQTEVTIIKKEFSEPRGFVHVISNKEVFGFVPVEMLTNNMDLAQKLTSKSSHEKDIPDEFKPGAKLKVVVSYVFLKSGNVHFNPIDRPKVEKLKIGDKTWGRVKQIKPTWVLVSLSTSGKSAMIHCSNGSKSDPAASMCFQSWKKGQLVDGVVRFENDKGVALSRRHMVAPSAKEILDVSELSEHDVVYAWVEHVSKPGAFFTLGRSEAENRRSGVEAWCMLANLSLDFIPDLVKAFPKGTRVRGKVLSVMPEKRRVAITLKPLKDFEDFSEGQILRANVKGVMSYGVFLRLQRSRICGLLHRSTFEPKKYKEDKKREKKMGKKVDEEGPPYFNNRFKKGEWYTVQITKILANKKRMSLRLASEDGDNAATPIEASVEKVVAVGGDDLNKGSSSEEESASSDVGGPLLGDDVEPLAVDDALTVDTVGTSNLEAMANAITNMDEVEAFLLEDSQAEDSQSEDSQSEDERSGSESSSESEVEPPLIGIQTGEKRPREQMEINLPERKRKKVFMGKGYGELKEKSEKAYEEGTAKDPENVDLWVEYIAFLLGKQEVDKARVVVKTALKRVDYRDMSARLTIWIAWLNLESIYGSATTVRSVYGEALKMNEPKPIYLQMASNYLMSEQIDMAYSCYQGLIRKYPKQLDAWNRYLTFLYQHYVAKGVGFTMASEKPQKECRNLLKRALYQMKKKDHVPVTCKFAQLEFKYGTVEEGRRIFENILSTYPTRVDIWSIYLDNEIKRGEQTVIRQLFERSTGLDLSTKKMKFFFKRYLEYEKKYGNKETVKRVKELARSWVAQKAKAS